MNKTQTLKVTIPKCFQQFGESTTKASNLLVVTEQHPVDVRVVDPYEKLVSPFIIDSPQANAFYMNSHFNQLPGSFPVFVESVSPALNTVSIVFTIVDANKQRFTVHEKVNKILIKLFATEELANSDKNPFYTSQLNSKVVAPSQIVSIPGALSSYDDVFARSDFRPLQVQSSYFENPVFLAIHGQLPIELRKEYKYFYEMQLSVIYENFQTAPDQQLSFTNQQQLQITADVDLQKPVLGARMREFHEARNIIKRSIRLNRSFVKCVTPILTKVGTLVDELLYNV